VKRVLEDAALGPLAGGGIRSALAALHPALALGYAA